MRSPCYLPPRLVLAAPRPAKLQLEPRPDHEPARHFRRRTIGLRQRQALRRDAEQPPHQLPAPADRLLDPAPQVLADGPGKLAILLELPGQPGRRHLQIVGRFDQARDVEHVAQLATDRLTLADGHTAGFVDEQSKYPAPPFPLPLGI